MIPCSRFLVCRNHHVRLCRATLAGSPHLPLCACTVQTSAVLRFVGAFAERQQGAAHWPDWSAANARGGGPITARFAVRSDAEAFGRRDSGHRRVSQGRRGHHQGAPWTCLGVCVGPSRAHSAYAHSVLVSISLATSQSSIPLLNTRVLGFALSSHSCVVAPVAGRSHIVCMCICPRIVWN